MIFYISLFVIGLIFLIVFYILVTTDILVKSKIAQPDPPTAKIIPYKTGVLSKVVPGKIVLQYTGNVSIDKKLPIYKGRKTPIVDVYDFPENTFTVINDNTLQYIINFPTDQRDTPDITESKIDGK